MARWFRWKLCQKNWSRKLRRTLSLKIDGIWKSDALFRIFDQTIFQLEEQIRRLFELIVIQKYSNVNSDHERWIQTYVSVKDKMAHRDMCILVTILPLLAHQNSNFYVENSFSWYIGASSSKSYRLTPWWKSETSKAEIGVLISRHVKTNSIFLQFWFNRSPVHSRKFMSFNGII